MTISRRRLACAGALLPLAGLPVRVRAAAAVRPLPAEPECDVLVIGAGAAGLAAAEAARMALAERVIVVEKGAIAGGHMLVSSGMLNALDPEGQRRAGRTDSEQNFFRDTYTGGGGLGDPDLISVMVRESHGVLEWLRSLGVEFDPVLREAYTGVFPRAHRTLRARSGVEYVRALVRRVRDLGVEIRYRHRALELIADDSGRIRGAVVSDLHGAKPVERVIAARTVVVATGGFGANVGMRMRWAPQISTDIGTTYSPGRLEEDPATGDGIRMAESVGAGLVGMEHVLAIPFWGGRVLDYPGAEIFLTMRGERFTDETASWDTVFSDLSYTGGAEFWVITDSRSSKGANFATKVQQGLVQSAETLDQLALRMDIPKARLEAVLSRYNNAARTGNDPDFGRTRFLQGISEPPYYFGRERFEVHYTCGGIAITPEARVRSAREGVIPGLFAAGETTGGVHGRFRLGGSGILDAFVFGRIAGRGAAAFAADCRAAERLYRPS